MNLNHFIQKIISKWVIYLNIKSKTITFLEETEENLCEFGLGRGLTPPLRVFEILSTCASVQ